MSTYHHVPAVSFSGLMVVGSWRSASMSLQGWGCHVKPVLAVA